MQASQIFQLKFECTFHLVFKLDIHKEFIYLMIGFKS